MKRRHEEVRDYRKPELYEEPVDTRPTVSVDGFQLLLQLYDKGIVSSQEVMRYVRTGNVVDFHGVKNTNLSADAHDSNVKQLLLQCFDKQLVSDKDVRRFFGLS